MKFNNVLLLAILCVSLVGVFAPKKKLLEELDTSMMKVQCQENPDFSLVITIYNLKTGVISCEYQGKRYHEPSRNPQKKALPAQGSKD